MTDSDQIKGKVEQAAGDLTGDKDLKREGKSTRPQAPSRTRWPTLRCGE